MEEINLQVHSPLSARLRLKRTLPVIGIPQELKIFSISCPNDQRFRWQDRLEVAIGEMLVLIVMLRTNPLTLGDLLLRQEEVIDEVAQMMDGTTNSRRHQCREY